MKQCSILGDNAQDKNITFLKHQLIPHFKFYRIKMMHQLVLILCIAREMTNLSKPPSILHMLFVESSCH